MNCCAVPELRVEAVVVNRSGVPDGRLRLHDVTTLIVTTCAGCGEVESLNAPNQDVRTGVGTVPRVAKPPMVMRNVRVPLKLWEAAKTKADERDENISDVIRDALQRYVNRR